MPEGIILPVCIGETLAWGGGEESRARGHMGQEQRQCERNATAVRGQTFKTKYLEIKNKFFAIPKRNYPNSKTIFSPFQNEILTFPKRNFGNSKTIFLHFQNEILTLSRRIFLPAPTKFRNSFSLTFFEQSAQESPI